MTTALVTATLVITGWGQRYAPDVMPDVADVRVAMGQIPPGTDPTFCVAVIDCGLIGQEGLLTWPDGRRDLVMVCDCSAAGDRARHQRNGLAVEVSYALAAERCHPIGPYCLPLDGPLDGMRLEVPPPAPSRAGLVM